MPRCEGDWSTEVALALVDILKVTIIAWKLLIEPFVVFKKILPIDNFF